MNLRLSLNKLIGCNSRNYLKFIIDFNSHTFMTNCSPQRLPAANGV